MARGGGLFQCCQCQGHHLPLGVLIMQATGTVAQQQITEHKPRHPCFFDNIPGTTRVLSLIPAASRCRAASATD